MSLTRRENDDHPDIDKSAEYYPADGSGPKPGRIITCWETVNGHGGIVAVRVELDTGDEFPVETASERVEVVR